MTSTFASTDFRNNYNINKILTSFLYAESNVMDEIRLKNLLSCSQFRVNTIIIHSRP